MITQCVEPTLLQLDESLPALYDSAYIGYGKDGFYFGSPGQYELRAIYRAHDGSVVFSNRLRLQIKAPISVQDEEVADLFFGDDQGKLLYLLGSDSEGLAGGRRAFARVQEKYAQHPMTSYARLVEGMNCSRPFKHISDRTVVSRPADRPRSDELLSRVVDVTMQSAAVEANPTADSAPPATPRLDNISLNMVMQRLTRVRKEAGDDRAAVDTARQMYDFFVHVEKVPEPVQQRILTQIGRIIGEEQAAALKRGETA
jgi:hypothetical protein